MKRQVVRILITNKLNEGSCFFVIPLLAAQSYRSASYRCNIRLYVYTTRPNEIYYHYKNVKKTAAVVLSLSISTSWGSYWSPNSAARSEYHGREISYAFTKVLADEWRCQKASFGFSWILPIDFHKSVKGLHFIGNYSLVKVPVQKNSFILHKSICSLCCRHF
jgi:hypothetical protein